MWFDPSELSKTKTIPPANFANPANCEAESTKTPRPISKLAELAAPLDSEIIVTCYTPNGNSIEVMARNSEHAEFLRRMNPKPC
ncbi:MAG: hypothetical protein M0R47_17150 [Methylobacter sp.]|jgi:hypothetical protein|uniref:hypothetical protein n=1 Tax=Methylobacter sp. TaxID=2051955 RepID=UPI0025FD346A|nr:hypothetical protein [Methylobacter sp.]MCK9622252.1 hypothetical protein [Methylobacter sp.]